MAVGEIRLVVMLLWLNLHFLLDHQNQTDGHLGAGMPTETAQMRQLVGNQS